MRTAILNYLRSAQIGPLILSQNLPWEDNNGPLYHHNRKHIYVDVDQVTQTAAVNDFRGSGAVDETTVVRVYFVTDAKAPISNLETLIDTIKNARLTSEITGVISRTCQVRNTFNGDDLVTEFEFSFRKLITN